MEEVKRKKTFSIVTLIALIASVIGFSFSPIYTNGHQGYFIYQANCSFEVAMFVVGAILLSLFFFVVGAIFVAYFNPEEGNVQIKSVTATSIAAVVILAASIAFLFYGFVYARADWGLDMKLYWGCIVMLSLIGLFGILHIVAVYLEQCRKKKG